MTPTEAIAIAVNQIQLKPGSSTEGPHVLLNNPRHEAKFSAESGITFGPRWSSLSWNWQLDHLGSQTRNLLNSDIKTSAPETSGSRTVLFQHGAIEERYVAHEHSVEQQFILLEKPKFLNKSDHLVIRGEIECDGSFHDLGDDYGWGWRDEESGDSVRLGTVYVYDARGESLPATMTATAGRTEIMVDGAALASAAYPVTVDPQITADTFAIGNADLLDGGEFHSYPTVAYHTDSQRFCVIWMQGRNAEWKLYAQLIDASTGLPIGSEILITANAQDCRPVIATDGGNFLIGWNDHGTSTSQPAARGRFLTPNGALLGLSPLQLSTDAVLPGAANLSLAAKFSTGYLFCWVDQSERVRTRPIPTSGAPLPGANSIGHPARSVSATYNPFFQEFCVAWSETTSGVTKIWARPTQGSSGTLAEAVLIAHDAVRHSRPQIVFHPSGLEYLCVWEGPAGNQPGNSNIYGRIYSIGMQPKGDAFPISNVGLSNNRTWKASQPNVTWSNVGDRYVVTWTEHHDEEDHEMKSAVVQTSTGARIGNINALFNGEFQDGALATASIGGQERILALGSRALFGSLNERGLRIRGLMLELKNDTLNNLNTPLFFGTTQANLRSSGSSVTYDALQNRYLVTWHSEREAENDWHVYARTVKTQTGEELSDDVIWVSGDQANPTATIWQENRYPRIAVAENGDYLIVWEASVPTGGPGAERKKEIMSRGWEAGVGWASLPRQISQTGFPGTATNFKAESPALTSGSNGDFAVVWAANGSFSSISATAQEIYALRVNNSDFQGVGAAIKLSDSLGNGLSTNPNIAYNPHRNEYQVIWEGSRENDPEFVVEEVEVMGQRLSANFSPEGEIQQRLTFVGDPGSSITNPSNSTLTYNSISQQYLIVWKGPTTNSIGREIHGQLLTSTGALQGAAFQISERLPEEDPGHWLVYQPTAAVNEHGQYFTAWSEAHQTSTGDTVSVGIRGRIFSPAGVSGDSSFLLIGPLPAGSPHSAGGPELASNGESFLATFQGNNDPNYAQDGITSINGVLWGHPESGAIAAEMQIRINQGQVHLTWWAVQGTRCVVMTSSDLQSWAAASGVIDAHQGENHYSLPFHSNEAAKYYRVMMDSSPH